MASLVKTQTLLDIARHSNKVIRMSRLMEETEAQYIVDEMGYLDSQSDPFDVLEALRKDLASTVGMLKEVSLMVDNLNDDHRAPELKSNENDFRTLFPKHYDPETQTLTLFGVPIKKGSNFSKKKPDELKSKLYDLVFSDVLSKYSYEDFKSHLSNLGNNQKTGRPAQDAPFHESLLYAARASQIPKWMDFYREAIKSAERFHDFKRSLKPNERKLVDEKVYTGRAMLYGVVKDSTYISKESGIEQLSPAHKKKPGLIKKIHDLVNEIDCLIAIEMASSTSVEKFHDVLVDIKEMRLDVPDAFELKSRKLGQYRASGLFAQVSPEGGLELFSEFGASSKDFKVIAVDVNSPTSLSHEITHFRDQDLSDPTRNKIIDHFSEKMDIGVLGGIIPDSRLQYFTNDREVLARLGEIGFKLLQHDYKENESLDSFVRRVRIEEGANTEHTDKIEYDVSLSKPIDAYLGGNALHREIYFKLEQWTPTELSIVKDYCHDYFYSPDPKVQERLRERIDSGELKYQSRKFHEEKMASRKPRVRKVTETQLVGAQFGKINPEELGDVYEEGLRAKLFDDGEFFEQMFKHAIHIGQGGTTKKLDRVPSYLWLPQLEGIFDTINRIDPAKSPGDALMAESSLLSFSDVMSVLDMVEKSDIEGHLERRSFLDQLTLLANSSRPYHNSEEDSFRVNAPHAIYVRLTNLRHRENSLPYKFVADNLVDTLRHLVTGLPDNLPLALQNATPKTKWVGISHDIHRQSIEVEQEPLVEKAEDYLDYVMHYRSADFLSGLEGPAEDAYIAGVVDKIPINKALPYRYSMKEALGRPEFTDKLLENDIIGKFGIKISDLNGFMKDVEKKLEGTSYGQFGWVDIEESTPNEEVRKKVSDFGLLRSKYVSQNDIDGATLLAGAALAAGGSKDDVSRFVAEALKDESLDIPWDKIFLDNSYGVYAKQSINNSGRKNGPDVMKGNFYGLPEQILLSHLPIKNMTGLMEGVPEINNFGQFERTASDFATFSLLYATAGGIVDLASHRQSYADDYSNGVLPFSPLHHEQRENAVLASKQDRVTVFNTLREVYVRGAEAMIPPHDKKDLHEVAIPVVENAKEEYLPFWLQAKAMSPELANAAIGGLCLAAGPAHLEDVFVGEVHKKAAFKMSRIGRSATLPFWMEGNVFKGVAPLLDSSIGHLKPIEKVKINLPSQIGDLPRSTLDEWVDAVRLNSDGEIPWEKLSGPQVLQLASYAKSDLDDDELSWSIIKSGIQGEGNPGVTPRGQLDEIIDQLRQNRPLIELNLTPDVVADFVDYARDELNDPDAARKVSEYHLNPSSRRDQKVANSKQGPKEGEAVEQEKKKQDEKPVPKEETEIKEHLGPERQIKMF
jgi:hypothetical protein